MKLNHNPIRSTILFGLLAGLAFIPLSLLLVFILPWGTSYTLIVWLYLATYSLLLTRWGGKSPQVIFLPLVLLFAAVFTRISTDVFLLFALGVLSWIRSGICFEKTLIKTAAAEFLLCLGGGALVAFFMPYSTAELAVGIWLFFLVQSLYFVLFIPKETEMDTAPQDIFEKAGRCADDILSGLNME